MRFFEKVLEKILYKFKFLFKKEEDYFKAAMKIRKILRLLNNKPLTSSSSFQKKISSFYLERIKNKKVLEVGCGIIGLGEHLILNLNKKSYFGSDISKDVLMFSQNLIDSREDLLLKKPRLILQNNFMEIIDLANNEEINFFIFNSVFTHMSSDLIKDYLKQIKKFVKQDIVVLGDISSPKEDNYKCLRGVDYFYSKDTFKEICLVSGWNCKFYADPLNKKNYYYKSNYFELS